MRASREAGRILALVAAIVILAITAWVCLIWATVVLLSRWLGTGLALVSVGGALVFLLAVILIVVSAMRGRKPAPPALHSASFPPPFWRPRALRPTHLQSVPRCC